MTRRLTGLSPGEDPDDKAAYWTARLMSGEMTADEQAEMKRWTAQSPENAAALAELQSLLGEADAYGEQLLAGEFERDLNLKAASKRRFSPSLRNIAATLAIAAATIVVTLFIAPNTGAPQSYQTAVGQFREIELEDGSEIELNTASLVRVDYDKRRRAVGLEQGEAFFNVEKDRSRPFVVKTAYAEIAVTGTSFSVASTDGRANVHVLTGVVDVKPLRGQSSTLLAGDMVEIGPDGMIGQVRRYDPALVHAWRHGKVRFREKPLGEAVVALNRYFSTPIAIDDAHLAQLPVTGEFDIRHADTAVKALSRAFNLTSRVDGDRIVLEENPSGE